MTQHRLQHFDKHTWFWFTPQEQAGVTQTCELCIEIKWKHCPENPAPRYLQVRYPIYFPPAAGFLNTSREREANLVQSITCFDAAICLLRHINCLDSLWGNIVFCTAPLCCFNTVFLCRMGSGWCATGMMMPSPKGQPKPNSMALQRCPCAAYVCKCAGVDFSIAPDKLTKGNRSHFLPF